MVSVQVFHALIQLLAEFARNTVGRQQTGPMWILFPFIGFHLLEVLFKVYTGDGVQYSLSLGHH